MAGKVEEIENELDSNRQQLQNEQQQEVLTNEELKTVIVVCGTTGVGKSQLAIELASFLKTEIISADSMQVYKGLDVITNKVTKEEQQQIPHHLLDFVPPSKEFNVIEFRDLATKIIDDLHTQGKIPIIVGGTHYYIQALLWKFSLLTEETGEDTLPEEKRENVNIYSEEEKREMYERLQEVDPLMATILHPNAIRKIQRSLEVFEKTGKKHSEIILERKSKDNQLRFRVCVFWIASEWDDLDKRLDARIDVMIQKGMFEELLEMRKISKQTTLTNSQGIFQSIGYKEFEDYLNSFEKEEEDEHEHLENLKYLGIEKMKSSTKRYARRQVHWIQKNFLSLNNFDLLNSRMYVLNATDLNTWNQNVKEKAQKIVQNFLKREEMENPMEDPWSIKWLQNQNGNEASKSLLDWEKYHCEICDKVLNGEHEWNVHLKSKTHKKRIGSKNKRKKNEQRRIESEEKRRKILEEENFQKTPIVEENKN